MSYELDYAGYICAAIRDFIKYLRPSSKLNERKVTLNPEPMNAYGYYIDHF
jgi:hypothetical protein